MSTPNEKELAAIDPLPPQRSSLRALTPARVGLGRTGNSIATPDQLQFQLDHALARDAVHARLDVRALVAGLEHRGLTALTLQSHVPSADRNVYLRRPDLGRILADDSATFLNEHTIEAGRLVFIIADGLSALAVERHALALIDAVLPLLRPPWQFGPACVVSQGRVAIGDDIGQRLQARITVTLIGERPGLSAADSLGVYLTWQPRVGRTDAERNCISNVRLEGLSYHQAAQRIVQLIEGAALLGATGVALKDTPAALTADSPST